MKHLVEVFAVLLSILCCTSATAIDPAVTAQTVQLSGDPAGADYLNASGALRSPWRQPGGDYFDKNGMLNRPDHHLAVPVERST